MVLQDVSPEVWRRIVVPGHWHLGLLHTVLQVAMGWTDSHLHDFHAGGVRYGEPESGLVAEVRREATARVHEVLPAVGARMLYRYDFGDDWRHEFVVEGIGEPVQQPRALRASGPARRRTVAGRGATRRCWRR